MINPNDIQIDYSYSYRTYADSLEGRPTPKNRIAKAKREAEELWGVRPTYMIEPGAKTGTLPTWTHMIWASGPALTEEGHGSALVIIWFSEFEPDTSRVLQALDWTKYAKDFEI
jgi:hypothetical protein